MHRPTVLTTTRKPQPHGYFVQTDEEAVWDTQYLYHGGTSLNTRRGHVAKELLKAIPVVEQAFRHGRHTVITRYKHLVEPFTYAMVV